MCSLVNQAASANSGSPVIFCHLFYEGSGTSACNPEAYLPCRTHASPLTADDLNITTSTDIIYHSNLGLK